jgi:hypothetical protein
MRKILLIQIFIFIYFSFNSKAQTWASVRGANAYLPYGLQMYKGNLYVASNFVYPGQGKSIYGIAKWDGLKCRATA